MRHYAAKNRYGNEQNIGFANTWGAFVFPDKASRDRYVADSYDLSVRTIKRRDVFRYIVGEPRPFSGEFYGITETCDSERVPGSIGEVIVITGDNWDAEHFYK